MKDENALNESDKAWSAKIAVLTADMLVRAKLVAPGDEKRATKIVADEIYVRLRMEDRPPSSN
jgi:hypothetical protein